MLSVNVLLSTYNGVNFLIPQLDSVLNQNGIDLHLFIRDDGSSDGTQEILEGYQQRDKRVKWYQGENVRPCKSFFHLVQNAPDCEYYSFCDQDDYWEPDKLSVAVEKLSTVDSSVPALYCSNLKVVDEHLNFCKLGRKRKYNTSNRYKALVDFPSVGCTQVFNRAAAKMLAEFQSDKCLMHDSWLYLICMFFGTVIYDMEPHILYRQHSCNVIGTPKSVLDQMKNSFHRILDDGIQPRLQSAKAFYEVFGNTLSEKDCRKILKVINYKMGFVNRMRLLFDFSVRSDSVTDDLKYRLLIIAGLI